MNMSRVAAAAVVAWVVDGLYGFVVYGKALESEFNRYPGVFRSTEAVMGNMPLMLGGMLIAFFALAYIFAKGHEGGNGVAEGVRFGLVLGLFTFGAISVGNYCVLNVGRKIAVEMAVAGFVEAIIIGVVLGLVYQPAARSKTVQV
jgi:hypothetical protein